MTRPLAVLPPEPAAVFAGLRDALSGSGPAILVSDQQRGVPAEVPKRVALVVETSGTSAMPKRVALSSDAILASAASSANAIGGEGQWLLALPVHYIAGLNVLARSLASRTEPVVLGGESFDPLEFARAAERMDAPLRFTALVPAQLGRLLAMDEAHDALRRFDRILIGGQSTPEALARRAEDLGILLTRTYGSSETCGGCVYDGTPIGNTNARIRDGQIELSGAVLADGYLGDDERTEASFPLDGTTRWYRTGDAGTLADGILSVTGRLDDVIISGGLKVSLADVERIIRGIPGQEDAVVVRAPSERWGEVSVLVTETPIELAPVRAAVTRRLGKAAGPKRVIEVESIPLLRSGKPDRAAAQRLAQ